MNKNTPVEDYDIAEIANELYDTLYRTVIALSYCKTTAVHLDGFKTNGDVAHDASLVLKKFRGAI